MLFAVQGTNALHRFLMVSSTEADNDFRINDNGVVVVRRALDYERLNLYDFEVLASLLFAWKTGEGEGVEADASKTEVFSTCMP